MMQVPHFIPAPAPAPLILLAPLLDAPVPPAPAPAAPLVPVPAPLAIPLPPPSPPPPALAAHPLPLACQPFDHNWPVHYMGKMDIICTDCQALHWLSEKLVMSHQTDPKFGMCCYQGKIKVPKLKDPPPELCHLLQSQDDQSKKFRDHIQNYNNALAMTSLGCNEDKEINKHGGGPYVFKVQGRLCHKAGSLIPREGQAPVYAQLYIYNAQDALNFCMNPAANASLDHTTMQTL